MLYKPPQHLFHRHIISYILSSFVKHQSSGMERCCKFLIAFLSLALALGMVSSFDFHEKELETEESFRALYQRWRREHTVSRSHEFKNAFASSKIGHHRMFRGAPRGNGTFMYANVGRVPKAVDWRKKGAVNPANNEDALLQAVAHQPVSVAIDAEGQAFQFYKEGVFNGRCATNLDHGVVVVGYGTTLDGTKYWIVRNSWGSDWGEGGYIRMQRGIYKKEGLCGIAMMASYPTVSLQTESSKGSSAAYIKDEL